MNDGAKSFSCQKIILLLLGGVVIWFALYEIYWMAHRPYSGIYFRFSVQGAQEILDIDPESPGAAAGLAAGDRILSVGDEELVD